MRWFLQHLFEKINIVDGLGLTLISSQQKGLVTTIKDVVPHVEHMNCARHIYANWKKSHKGQELKSLFWKTVNTTHEVGFSSCMEELQVLNATAHEDFMK